MLEGCLSWVKEEGEQSCLTSRHLFLKYGGHCMDIDV